MADCMLGRLIATLPGYQWLDSLKVEADGSISVATLFNGGITTFQPDGRYVHVPMPDPVTTNLRFGGADLRDALAPSGPENGPSGLVDGACCRGGIAGPRAQSLSGQPRGRLPGPGQGGATGADRRLGTSLPPPFNTDPGTAHAVE